jgi:hypothetical protein
VEVRDADFHPDLNPAMSRSFFAATGCEAEADTYCHPDTNPYCNVVHGYAQCYPDANPNGNTESQ